MGVIKMRSISVQKNKKIKIGLVQINNSFSGQNYLPYSVGCLQAYAEKYFPSIEKFEFLLPIYSRISVQKAANALKDAEMVFFSTYVWNSRISLELAKQIKQNRPETIIVFGGPQVPDRIEDFLRQYSFIDVACHGEGEKVFVSILENCINGTWESVPSISYLNNVGQLVQNPRAERIADFSQIPSPYLSGVFDPLMKANPKEEWIVLWETNRGCPFSCTFCDWGSAVASKVYRFEMERILSEVDWFSQHKIEFIYCCDANFGILTRDLDIVLYVAKNKKEHDYPRALSVQNTKNSTLKSYEIQKAMQDSGLNKGVTLSLQSIDENTLKSVKRSNIKTEVYQELQHQFTKDNIATYTDVILALPGETYESFVNGVSTIIENGQHNRIQFNNLSILPNAEMGNPEYQKKYGLIVKETDIINIHGSLSDTEEIKEKQQLVVGTNTMSKEDWVKARVFSWMTSLLHFDKVMQIPFIVLHNIYHITYRELVEIFTEDKVNSPILSEIKIFFVNKALDIQNGGSEYCESKQWLNIWWPADELMLVKMCAENKLSAFYREAEHVMKIFFQKNFMNDSDAILRETISLNQNLIKRPFQYENTAISLSYNIWEVYQAALKGISVPLEDSPYHYGINREDEKWLSWNQWCKEVIWYGNKKGAYLYNAERADFQQRKRNRITISAV